MKFMIGNVNGNIINGGYFDENDMQSIMNVVKNMIGYSHQVDSGDEIFLQHYYFLLYNDVFMGINEVLANKISALDGLFAVQKQDFSITVTKIDPSKLSYYDNDGVPAVDFFEVLSSLLKYSSSKLEDMKLSKPTIHNDVIELFSEYSFLPIAVDGEIEPIMGKDHEVAEIKESRKQLLLNMMKSI